MNTIRRLIRALIPGPRFNIMPVSRDLRNADQLGQHQAREQERLDAALLAKWNRRVRANVERRAL